MDQARAHRLVEYAVDVSESDDGRQLRRQGVGEPPRMDHRRPQTPRAMSGHHLLDTAGVLSLAQPARRVIAARCGHPLERIEDVDPAVRQAEQVKLRPEPQRHRPAVAAELDDVPRNPKLRYSCQLGCNESEPTTINRRVVVLYEPTAQLFKPMQHQDKPHTLMDSPVRAGLALGIRTSTPPRSAIGGGGSFQGRSAEPVNIQANPDRRELHVGAEVRQEFSSAAAALQRWPVHGSVLSLNTDRGNSGP